MSISVSVSKIQYLLGWTLNNPWVKETLTQLWIQWSHVTWPASPHIINNGRIQNIDLLIDRDRDLLVYTSASLEPVQLLSVTVFVLLSTGGAVAAAAPPAASSTAAAAAGLEAGPSMPAYYLVKWITWKEKKTPIITQSENGPCPLLAIMNTLFLRWKVKTDAAPVKYGHTSVGLGVIQKLSISIPWLLEVVCWRNINKYTGIKSGIELGTFRLPDGCSTSWATATPGRKCVQHIS